MNRDIVYGPEELRVGQLSPFGTQAKSMMSYGMGTIPTVKDVYVGDFPPWDNISPVIHQPWVPNQYILPYTLTTTWVVPLQNTWRVDKSRQDKITLSLDLPGVKENDLCVEIDSGVLKLNAKRFDTGESITQSYVLGVSFDQNTAKATLQAGVLTIDIMKHKEHLSKKIKIESK